MATSMRLSEHESEGYNEELVSLIVADMKNPVTPVLEATLVGKRVDNAGRVIACLSKIVHYDAAVIDKHLSCVGAVEIDLRHVQPPSNWCSQENLSVASVLDGAVQKPDSVTL
jgi:hypothetical protein